MLGKVEEIMNRELLTVDGSCALCDARALARKFEIAALPVLDATRRPVGILSFGDAAEGEGSAAAKMTTPALCVPTSTSILAAARLLATTDRHHLVVVDEQGAAIGIVSSLDLLRAVLDLPARHPAAFPHWDDATQASWTDDLELDQEGEARAPKGPGVLLLIRVDAEEPNEVVWVEECVDLPARVRELASRDFHPEPELWRYLAQSRLRFRAAVLPDAAARRRVADHYRMRLRRSLPPGAWQ